MISVACSPDRDWPATIGTTPRSPTSRTTVATVSVNTGRRCHTRDLARLETTGTGYPRATPFRSSVRVHSWLLQLQYLKARRARNRACMCADRSRPDCPPVEDDDAPFSDQAGVPVTNTRSHEYTRSRHPMAIVHSDEIKHLSPGSTARPGISSATSTETLDAARPPLAWRPSTRARIVIDVGVFVLFLALSAPMTTGLAVHEWLVVPFIPVFFGHVITSWSWVTTMLRRGARPRGRPRTNRTLDVILFVLMTTAVYSGLAISVEFLPSVGLAIQPRDFWLSVHAASSSLLVPLIAAHLYLHWRWVRRHVLRRRHAEGTIR